MAISCVEPKNSAIFSGRWHGTEWKWIQESWKYELRWLVLVLTDNEGRARERRNQLSFQWQAKPLAERRPWFLFTTLSSAGVFFSSSSCFHCSFCFFWTPDAGRFSHPNSFVFLPASVQLQVAVKQRTTKNQSNQFFFLWLWQCSSGSCPPQCLK